MKYIRYTSPSVVPIAGMRRWLQDAFDAFDEFSPRLENAFRAGHGSTAADLYEADNAFQVILELPGFAKDDVSVSLENNVLAVRAGRKTTGDGSEENVSYAVGRSVAVPDNVDAEKVGAKLENGILTVTLPKAESAKTKTVVID
ncbi:MAG: Hsp20/alpha crystallin family protein [Verrucomicrobiota bacterium]